MMSILRRYISTRFIAAFAFVLSALAALALMLDLMEQADQVLGASNGGALALLQYSALRLPDIAAQMLPIASLLGMLLVLGQFMRHRELVAMWGSGASPTGLMLALTPIVAGARRRQPRQQRPGRPGEQLGAARLGWGEARKTGLVGGQEPTCLAAERQRRRAHAGPRRRRPARSKASASSVATTTAG